MARKASRTTPILLSSFTEARMLRVQQRGFTIVELLIVVVVIAILAAITIVAYNGIQNRAKASAVQTTVKQAYTKIQSYAVLNAEAYPTDIAAAGINSTDGATYQYRFDNDANPRTFVSLLQKITLVTSLRM